MTKTFKNLSPNTPDTVTVGSLAMPPTSPFPVESLQKMLAEHTEAVVTALEVVSERLAQVCEALPEPAPAPVVNVTVPAPQVTVSVPEGAAPVVTVHVPEALPAVAVAAPTGTHSPVSRLTLPLWFLVAVILIGLLQAATLILFLVPLH